MKIIELVLFLVLSCPYKSGRGVYSSDVPNLTGTRSGPTATTTTTPATATTTAAASTTAQSAANKVTLNIDRKASTAEYDYRKDAEFHKFNAKSGNVFNKVMEDKKLVWESDGNVFGTMVGTNGDFLIILLTDKFRMFIKSNGDWTDITSPNIFKIKFLTANDNQLTFFKFKYIPGDQSHEIRFNPGSECHKIKYDGVIVWNPSGDPKFGPIKSLKLDLKNNKLTIINHEDVVKELDLKSNNLTTINHDNTVKNLNLKSANTINQKSQPEIEVD
ncbi:hypothetical protein TpMuguga_04g00100 [Theileria parva strain Muguga]|uniref:SfiI-subtelomeric related protein family member n=1 Tax=Theileria parva TaxID=5875 RepID=Q4N387_THEPA|nr:uncharacterized protein TpMuguga_04g00100 [Theileria parva strain Muguga]EAN31452.1 hypothetical protein TpMuguga_04g00100 [Theileria parva strain Muguga]|eukprot:XP_763735.1 hypothetical protein [Theileria parva strain Muguga]